MNSSVTKGLNHDRLTGEEWFEGMEVWNQVFRIRYGPRLNKLVVSSVTEDKDNSVHAKPPPLPHPLSLHTAGSMLELSESEESELEENVLSPLLVTVEKPGSLAREDWETFQSKVSRQLLSRYFYSCEYM